MTIPTKDGVYPGLTREQYDRIDRTNWSLLKHMKKSPAHFRAAKLAKTEEDTDAKRLGRATHVAVLEPERFRAQWAVWDGGRRYGKEWDKFQEKHAGLEILTEDQYQTVVAISQAVLTHEDAAPYLRGGAAENTVLWTDPVTGVECKARLDVSNVAVVDLKTTKDAAPEAFARQCWNFGHGSQAAMYRDGHAFAGGGLLPSKLIAVENQAPHIVQVYAVPDSILELGRAAYRELLDRLVECRRTNSWPGYATGELTLDLPSWMKFSDNDTTSGIGLEFEEEQAAHA